MVAAGKVPVSVNVHKTRCSVHPLKLLSFPACFVFCFCLSVCFQIQGTKTHTSANITSPFAWLWRANSRVTSSPAPHSEDVEETFTSVRVFQPISVYYYRYILRCRLLLLLHLLPFIQRRASTPRPLSSSSQLPPAAAAL